MKPVFTRAVIATFLIALSTASHAQITPVYFNFVTHNETSDPLDYDGSPTDFLTMRTLVREVCDTIIAKNAKLNMQVDANFIIGCLNYDNAATSPFDILEWANNSPLIDVDGHNHFNPNPGLYYNPYNYVDLAYLLDSCGVNLEKNILGGVTYATTPQYFENWVQYATPATGYTFSDFTWEAEIIWGAATPGHVDDFEAYGIWKPMAATETSFGIHDPSQSLYCMGGGCKGQIGYIIHPTNGNLVRTTSEVVANILSICDDINTYPTSPQDFYTLNMLMNFRDFPNIPNMADSVAAIIDGIQPYVDNGRIIWSTLSEKFDTWAATHTDPNDHFMLECGSIPTTSNDDLKLDELRVQPNPFSDQLMISGVEPDTEIQLMDALGRLHVDELSNSARTVIKTDHLPIGLYFIRAGSKGEYRVLRSIKQ